MGWRFLAAVTYTLELCQWSPEGAPRVVETRRVHRAMLAAPFESSYALFYRLEPRQGAPVCLVVLTVVDLRRDPEEIARRMRRRR